MVNNLEGYVLSISTFAPDQLPEIDRDPDIIFLDGEIALTAEDIARITRKYPRKTYVVLSENPGQKRRMYLNMGIDEVLSMTELRSDVAKHLLEKLLALKDLAAAELRIEQGEARFRGIIEHSHDIIALLDADGTILYTSPAFTRQLGFALWEVLGQGFFDYVEAGDRGRVTVEFKSLVEYNPGDGQPLAFRFRHRDGGWRDFEVIGSNLLLDVTVRSVVLHCRDVTAQKETELELDKYRRHLEDLIVRRTREAEEANRRADTVIAASPDALIAIDEKGVITFVSQHYYAAYPASAKLLTPGVHIMEAFTLVAHEIGLAEDDPRAEEMRAWWRNPKGRMEFKMGHGTWLRLQARRMTEGNGIVISTTNITAYKRQQALLAAQSAELETSLAKEKTIVEQQKTFVSMVSHEFRTPLTIIDGNAQIIQRRGDTIGREGLEKRAITVRSAVERLVRLIDTIISGHMIESGMLQLEPKRVDLGAVIHEVGADIQDISPNHKIHVNVRGLPAAISLDEKLMRKMRWRTLFPTPSNIHPRRRT
ncbi:MAG: PAS domain S-box protein [Micavibrio sp.]|nr:PAS domain S-box protein [Micavibrio sp.]